MQIFFKIKSFFISLLNYIISKRKLLIYLSVIGVILINFVFSQYGIINRISLELNKKDLFEKISAEQMIKDSLYKRINILNNDTLEIERLAREYYGMIKPGEKLFIFKKK
jgi:cell division protein FtsB